MFAVIFEVYPTVDGKGEYLEVAAGVLELLKEQKGCISAERFQSLADDGKLLSLSYWESEEAIEKWRNVMEHRAAQKKGKEAFFSSYTIHVADVVRRYTNIDRAEAPQDSREALG